MKNYIHFSTRAEYFAIPYINNHNNNIYIYYVNLKIHKYFDKYLEIIILKI